MVGRCQKPEKSTKVTFLSTDSWIISLKLNQQSVLFGLGRGGLVTAAELQMNLQYRPSVAGLSLCLFMWFCPCCVKQHFGGKKTDVIDSTGWLM